MSDPTIQCPNCKTEFKLNEQLAAPIVEATKQRFRDHLNAELAKVQEREAELEQQKSKLQADRQELERAVDRRVDQERVRIAEEEARKARLKVDHELAARTSENATLSEALKERDKKLGEARQAQAELLREKRELAEARAALELTVEQRIQEGIGAAKEAGKKEAEGALQLTVRERDHQIEQMRRQIEDLKRKAEQGSQQLQGEVLELELEETLRRAFPTDLIEPVGKGELGGDLLQKVVNTRGTVVGSILWEVKRTKNWQDSWLAKLRGDQRRVNADLALIVSQTLPKEMHTLDLRDEVWITSPQCAVPIAIALRELLISVFGARRASEGQLSKQEQLYQYLTGPRFKHRIRAILEQYSNMRRDLDQERRVIMKQWAKREQQLQSVADSIAGLAGDLHGIAGQSMMELEGLSLSLLEAPEEGESQAA